MGKPADELTGIRFGRLLVLEKCQPTKHGGKPRWKCRCDCGKIAEVQGVHLKGKRIRSCGCIRRDRAGEFFRKHGKSRTMPYCMFYDARKRAQRLGLPFDIEPEDIVIPERCPVLGFELAMDGKRDARPSLDRFIPCLGYTKSNIRVISFRANRIKSDASLEEAELLLQYMRQL